jgi:hypothetical protein
MRANPTNQLTPCVFYYTLGCSRPSPLLSNVMRLLSRNIILFFVILSVLLLPGCGSSQWDRCSDDSLAKCEDGHAMHCEVREGASHFTGNGLVWVEQKCDGPTPVCVSRQREDRNYAFCAATDSKLCDKSDTYICHENRVHRCTLNYPAGVFKTCNDTETCIQTGENNNFAKCKSK